MNQAGGYIHGSRKSRSSHHCSSQILPGFAPEDGPGRKPEIGPNRHHFPGWEGNFVRLLAGEVGGKKQEGSVTGDINYGLLQPIEIKK
jgi:hypothetical protein